MAKGHWSFLHEWVIYDYLLARADEGTLRLKQVIVSGTLAGKPKWIKVEEIKPITGTAFPDIQAIQLKGKGLFRSAEVKFTSSLFSYHQSAQYTRKFADFVKQNGFLIVASHDYLPKGLIDKYPELDVYEIEIEDFISFCRENFTRLLNRQIKAHASTRVWLMYQGPNFNEGSNQIQPARQSRIWCPTENLTGFDLAVGDRILFYKTSGLDRIKLQNAFLKKRVIDPRWTLREICVAEVKSKIFSRTEYLQRKKKSLTSQLWKNDPCPNNRWRWGRVFEFSIVKVIKTHRPMTDLFQSDLSKHFVLKAWEAFCFGKSRELALEYYRSLLEEIA